MADAPSQGYDLRALHKDVDTTNDGDDAGSDADSYRQSDSDFETSPGRGGASTKRRRPYKPRSGPAKERNREAQRRYRERLKERAAEAEAELASVTAELEKARLVQDALRVENTALSLMRQYSDGLLFALRSTAAAAAESLASSASSAASSFHSVHANIVDYLWNKTMRPSDAVLRIFAKNCSFLPTSAVSTAFVGRLVAALEQWHRSPPTVRENIEKKLSQVFETRARLVAILLTEFPENEGILMRHPIDNDAMSDLIDHAASLSSSDVLDTVVLTSEQTAALNSHWDVYCARYRGAKGLVTAAAAQVHLATEPFLSEANSLRGAMRRNTDAQQGAAAAASFLAEERLARVELLSAAIRTLNPVQFAWLQLMSMRLLPRPDIVGTINMILPHLARAPVPTPAALAAQLRPR